MQPQQKTFDQAPAGRSARSWIASSDKYANLWSPAGPVIGDCFDRERTGGDVRRQPCTVRRRCVSCARLVSSRPRPRPAPFSATAATRRSANFSPFRMTLSPASFRVQGFRRIIEVGLGDQVLLTATDADFDELGRINRRMLDADTPLAAAEGDFAFHTALISDPEPDADRDLPAAQAGDPSSLTVGKTQRPAMRATFEAHAEIIAAMRRRDHRLYLSDEPAHGLCAALFEPGVVYDSQSREQDAAGFSDPDTT